MLSLYTFVLLVGVNSDNDKDLCRLIKGAGKCVVSRACVSFDLAVTDLIENNWRDIISLLSRELRVESSNSLGDLGGPPPFSLGYIFRKFFEGNRLSSGIMCNTERGRLSPKLFSTHSF